MLLTGYTYIARHCRPI